jgi:hypothetical protein
LFAERKVVEVVGWDETKWSLLTAEWLANPSFERPIDAGSEDTAYDSPFAKSSAATLTQPCRDSRLLVLRRDLVRSAPFLVRRKDIGTAFH